MAKKILNLIFLFLLLTFSTPVFPQNNFDGFKCSGALYQIYGKGGGYSLAKLVVNQETNKVAIEDEFTLPSKYSKINSAAYNVKDGYIYFVARLKDSSGKEIPELILSRIKIDLSNNSFKTEDLGRIIASDNNNPWYYVGEIDFDGNYWLMSATEQKLKVLRLQQLLDDYKEQGKQLPFTEPLLIENMFNNIKIGANVSDFVMNPDDNKLYGWDRDKRRLAKINPYTTDPTNIVEFVGPVERFTGTGATYFVDGMFWGYTTDPNYNTQQTSIIIVDPETGVVVNADPNDISRGPATGQNDGCSCAYVFELSTSVSQTDFCLGAEHEFEIYFEITNKTKQDINNLELNYILPEGFVFTTNMMAMNADGEYELIPEVDGVINSGIQGSTEINSSNSSFNYKYDEDSDVYKMKVGVKVYDSYEKVGELVLGKRILDNTVPADEQKATAMIPLFSSKHGSGFNGYENAYSDSLKLNFYETPRFSDNDPLKLTRDGKVCGTEMTLDFPMSVLTVASTDLTAEEEHKVYVASILDADGLDASSKVEVEYLAQDAEAGVQQVKLSISDAANYGSYTISWVEDNGTCSDGFDSEIRFDESVLPQILTVDQLYCSSSMTESFEAATIDLTAAMTANGAYTQWEVAVDEGESYTSLDFSMSTIKGNLTQVRYLPSDPSSVVFDLKRTFRNGECVSESVLEDIVFDAPVYASIASPPGPEGICINEAGVEQLVTLSGVKPDHGTGVWSVESPAGAIDAEQQGDDYVINLGGTAPGQYTFVWTVANGSCEERASTEVIFHENVDIQLQMSPEICGDEILLDAQANADSYEWSKISGPSGWLEFEDINSASTNVKVSSFGEHVFKLSVDRGVCHNEQEVSVRFDRPVSVQLFSSKDLDGVICGDAVEVVVNEQLDNDGNPLSPNWDYALSADFEVEATSSLKRVFDLSASSSQGVMAVGASYDNGVCFAEAVPVSFELAKAVSEIEPMDPPFECLPPSDLGTAESAVSFRAKGTAGFAGVWEIVTNVPSSDGQLSAEIVPGSVVHHPDGSSEVSVMANAYGEIQVKYVVEVNDKCQAEDQISFSFRQALSGLEMSVFAEEELEDGARVNEGTTLGFHSSAGGISDFRWNKDGLFVYQVNETTTAYQDAPSADAVYEVSAVNAFGCGASRSFNISVNKRPVLRNDHGEVLNTEVLVLDILSQDEDENEVELKVGLTLSDLTQNGVDLNPNTAAVETEYIETTSEGLELWRYELQADGKLKFTPNPEAGFVGPAVIRYTLTDKEGAQSFPAYVRVHVYGAPVAISDTVEVIGGREVVFDLVYPIDRAQDWDPDDDLLVSTIKLLSEPESGFVVDLDPSTGALIYQSIEFVDMPEREANDADQRKRVEFIYEICDSKNNCDTAKVVIYVLDDRISIPNVFTPNTKDGYNDTFVIKGVEYYETRRLQIFNRWGKLVYENERYDQSWDGRSNVGNEFEGNVLSKGTYFYVLDLDDQEQYKYSGWVYIAD
ncbi:gliding motility-associated-like protein [Aureibacter tunicatorum]|uniref:Gliding motility-associated-like protein n=1 Tax=Aureibacter tunicatorum TaxID=866807 RepID=A0AAE3XU66_9BACT|nr:gliding motility-associated-like protein [Aureibacter tunicatorum]